MEEQPTRRDPEWWEARYRSGDIPWDTGITPPEVVALVESGKVEPGWAYGEDRGRQSAWFLMQRV